MAPPPPASKPKATGFTCNFCLEEGLALACTRKNDLKRHIEDFHHTNSQWLCPIPDCGMAFDWESAFKVHTKSQHEALRIKPPPCKVALCEQVVFACGFETCMQVFEASSDGGGPAKFKDYLAHVIKHYDEGLTSGQWSYTRRMRNLLGQSAMRGAWPRIEREGPYHMIQWDPQNSNILRKKLETRHIDDIQSIVDSAIALGWLPDSPCEAQPALRRPLREGCTMPIIGHAHAASSAVPLPPLHALPLPMSPPVQYTNTAQAPPMPQYFHHPEAAAPAAYMSPAAPPPQQAAVVYSPQSSPMYMGNPTPVAEAGYSPLPADYQGSFTTSPPTPLYKTLPQMMHEESIDPQLYMEWTPECEAFAAADHTASPHASAGFGSPAVKEEMDLEGDEMFPPLDTHA
ncbi:hypothetical protein K4F52_003901 [Lecanicillium sp. MT-2017a]|nr:hypothetical protein K4F52_003901 [Lecanicillium sp. MT-2017a]